jgi:uncharacterized delta-60 repeat protein
MTPFISGANRMGLPKLLAAVAAGCFCLAFAPGAVARGGDLDSTFGTNGVAALRTASDNVAYYLATASDGTSIAVRMGSATIDVQRFLANGRPDPAWGTNGTATLTAQITVLAVMAQPDGRVVLGGSLATGPGWGFARLGQAGTLDASFGNAGWSLLPGVVPSSTSGMSLGVLSDGRIAVVGYPNLAGPLTPGYVTVVRLGADGQLDPTFGAGGIVDHALGIGWTLEPNIADRVLGDGTVELARVSSPNVAVSRLQADGTAGTTRSSGVPFSLDAMNLPRLQYEPDGSLLATTTPPDLTGQQTTIKVARLSAHGTLDQSVGVGGVATARVAPPVGLVSIAATLDGEFVAVVAPQGGSAFQSPFQVVKFPGDVRLDARFGNAGTATMPNYAAQTAAMSVDGFLTILAQTPTGRHDGALIHMQAVGDIVEFYNSILDHYFMALDGTEAAGIDNGAAGPAWTRTHVVMKPGGLAPVCRFYGTPGIGPNSHFYTAQPAECALVQRDPGWTLEGTGFYTTRVVDAACPSPLVPIHRYYNNRAAQDDSNHRYVRDGDLGLRAFMEARGWIHEGIVFCVKP